MRYIIIFLISFLFYGCSFKSGHENFIDSMNIYLTDYYDYEKEKKRWWDISDKYLVKTDYDEDGNTLNHFETHPKFCDGACRYYIVVNKKGTIINWGFDPCDKEKCCQSF